MPHNSTYPIAHRGGSRRYAENTMPTFAEAVENVDVVETDVRCTRDGVLICAHDPTLERCHGDTRRISGLTWDELHEAAPDIPKLADVLAEFGQKAGWFLDCKVGNRRAINELLQQCEAHNIGLETGGYIRAGVPLPPGHAVFENAQASVLQSVRSRTGAGCVELIRESSSGAELTLTAPFITAYAQGVVIPDRLVNARLVRFLRALKLGIYVYTVADPQRYAELVEFGVSGIFTNTPERSERKNVESIS